MPVRAARSRIVRFSSSRRCRSRCPSSLACSYACFAEWKRLLRPAGRCVILIGDAIVSKQPVAVGDTFVDLLERRELALEKRWVRELQATRRSFNVKNSRISHEHVLLFQKRS
jgi:hypothetical protein